MSAFDILSHTNGLKTTNTVLGKQQSGLDAAQKANPQDAAAQMNTNTAQAMLHGKENNLTPPKDAHEQAVRMNQNTAEGMLNGSIPIVKKEPKEEAPKEKAQPEKPKQMSYAEMFKILNPENNETPEQKAMREKKEKRNMRIAAFGDGLRALSNMVFATQGARVIHNPQTDLSAVQLKRKQMIDAQREKNKAAWLNGYQRALALDEEARKNNNTLAEQMRYHDILADKYNRSGDQADRKLDQKDVQLDQNQQKIDLSKLKYTNDTDYRNNLLKIKQMLADGQISHWAAQDATARLREGRIAAKAGASSGGNKTTAGYWYEYYDMMDTPDGQKKIGELKRKLRIKNVTQTNVRYLMDKLKGRHSDGAAPSSGGGKTKAASKGKGSAASSNGGKKKTGVKW